MLESIVGFSQLYLKQGDLSRVEYLSRVVQCHPSCNSEVQLRLDELMQLIDGTIDIEQEYSAVVYASEMKLELVVKEILDHKLHEPS